MKTLKILSVIFGLVVLLALFAALVIVPGYNIAKTLDENVKAAWAQVDNQLLRRYDLIPNIVETVKGLAAQEEKIYLGVAQSREAYFQARTVAEKAQAAGQVEGALARLLMLQETYPQLKSNEAFLKLQDQLEGTENRLTVERQRYNEAVQKLNTYVRSLHGSFFARMAGVSQAVYYEIPGEVKATPKVDFSDIRNN